MFASLGLYALAAILLVLAAAGARRRPRELALAAASIAATLALSEAGLRLLHPPALRPLEKVASPLYHHVHRPGSVMYQGTYDGTDVVVETNEDGFRSRHDRASFNDHSIRVAVLGDSFTFGSGVRQEEPFPQVMERVVAAALPEESVAVLNAAVPSWSPLVGVRVFDGIVRHYGPQHVFYVLDVTDIGDDFKYASELVLRDGREVFDLQAPTPASYRGALAQVAIDGGLVDALLLPWRAMGLAAAPAAPAYDWYDFEVEVGGVVETNRFFIYRHPLGETRPWFDGTWENVRRLSDLVHATGAGFTLVLMPRFHHWNPRECPENWEAAEYALDEPWQFEYFRFFEERSAEADFEIVSLLPAFEESAEAPLVFAVDPHLNAAGHELAARVLAARVLALASADTLLAPEE